MKEIIKKYIGVIGVLIAFPLIGISAYYRYYFNNEFEVLGILGIILWITTTTLEYLLEKEKPKNWLITLALVSTFFIAIVLVMSLFID
jgi:CDP-diglyceride synthetase